MAHLDSFTKADARRILREYFRELEDYKNLVDKNLSHLNYSYGDCKSAKECLEKIQMRVNEIMQGRDVQKQTNVMSTWVITCPQDFVGDHDKEKQFFDTCYQFCKDRYGEANVIGGFVHNDETTPHMHVIVVPEAESRKTHKMTVSSASKFTRAELHEFHNDLEDECYKKFGKHKLVKNGKTKGNFSLDQLKEVTAINQKHEQEIALYREFLQKHNALDKFDKWIENINNKSENQSQKEASNPIRETVVVQDEKQAQKEAKQVEEVVSAVKVQQKPTQAQKRDLSSYDPVKAKRELENQKKAMLAALDWSDVNTTTRHINSTLSK